MSVELDLQQLIARAQSGEKGAFSELYGQFAGRILRFLYAKLRDQETAQDLTQEVFIRVLNGIARFEYRDDSSFIGWIYRIATNVMIGHVRRGALAQTPLDESLGVVDPHGQDDVYAVFNRVSLAQAMRQLTPDQQQVLHLRFFADLSNAEIARQLGKTEGSIKALQHRALLALQQIIPRDGDDSLALDGHHAMMARTVGGD
jgi:RNA polymerase sigma-70 factor (ECF subfamily)